MKIEQKNITVKNLYEGYEDKGEEGIVGYSGTLDIRPSYQREFIYKDKQRDAVINTIKNNFPLNVMYWVENYGGSYEVLDGQQRTVSICQYIAGDFALDHQYFHNLTKEEQDQILDYELMVYFCEGTDSDKLDWFKTINIAGEKLTNQELRNAIFSGTWLADAKRYFSKTGCVAYQIASKYMKGSAIRQDYLETAISWLSNNNIEDFMGKNQDKLNANSLWLYFKKVINWVDVTFPNYRKQMKGLNWGALYDVFKDAELDPVELEAEISELMMDEDVTKKPGIYEYVLTKDPKFLSIRAFSQNQKIEAYERQKGICNSCGGKFEIDKMNGDHIIPWSKGGKTSNDNCQMLCGPCNKSHGAK